MSGHRIIALVEVVSPANKEKEADRYVNAPLEAAYQAAFGGLPVYWRGVLQNTGG